MDLKGLIKLILNQKSYFIKVNQIIRKMKIDLRNQQNNNINDKDQIKSKNDKKKNELKKNPYYQKKSVSYKKVKKQMTTLKKNFPKKKKN